MEPVQINCPCLLGQYAFCVQCKTIKLAGSGGFQLLQDDLLHPILGGNKLRKLDALLPFLKAEAVTDVVSI